MTIYHLGAVRTHGINIEAKGVWRDTVGAVVESSIEIYAHIDQMNNVGVLGFHDKVGLIELMLQPNDAIQLGIALIQAGTHKPELLEPPTRNRSDGH